MSKGVENRIIQQEDKDLSNREVNVLPRVSKITGLQFQNFENFEVPLSSIPSAKH